MTDLVKLHVMLSTEELADIERFREREGKRSKKEAVRELIRLGLRAANETNQAGRVRDLS
jgi:head-tail adaptor